nr:hypothetical protein [Tanacetum cinerariifolium]
MVDYKCTKKFPKQFNESTVIEDSSYGIYKRRNNAATIKKRRTDLHNGYVVPYNLRFIRRYQALINVEYCNQKQRIWTQRKQAKSLGRIHHVPSSWGELYYLRAILNKVRGPMEWDDLKKVDDVLYPTYKDACYARGLLQDDKEYIDGLLEAKVVWEKTWSVMVADVLNVERIKQGIPVANTSPPPPLTSKPKKIRIPRIPRRIKGLDHDPKSHMVNQGPRIGLYSNLPKSAKTGQYQHKNENQKTKPDQKAVFTQ